VAAKTKRLIIEPWVPSYLAKRLNGLCRWFKEYAAENLPDEALAPVRTGCPLTLPPS
jgi:hypothetical protein